MHICIYYVYTYVRTHTLCIIYVIICIDVARKGGCCCTGWHSIFAHRAAVRATQPVAFVRRVDCGKCGTTSSFQLKRSAKCFWWFMLPRHSVALVTLVVWMRYISSLLSTAVSWCPSLPLRQPTSQPQHVCGMACDALALSWLPRFHPAARVQESQFLQTFMLEVLICWTASSTFQTSPERKGIARP